MKEITKDLKLKDKMKNNLNNNKHSNKLSKKVMMKTYQKSKPEKEEIDNREKKDSITSNTITEIIIIMGEDKEIIIRNK